MSKRKTVGPGKSGQRWDRRQTTIAIVAILIVVLMVGSSLVALLVNR